MGWLIALAVIVLLAVLPLGVSVKYDGGGVLAKVIAGPIRVTVFPLPKKEKKEIEKKPKKAEHQKPKKSGKQPKEEDSGSGMKLMDFLPLVDTALQMLGDLRRKLRLDRIEMKLIMASDDPCDLAVNYGRAWAALGNLWPRLERLFVIKKRDVQVECDFTADTMYIFARLDITITLGRLLYVGVRYGLRALKQFMNIKKGGAEKNEQ